MLEAWMIESFIHVSLSESAGGATSIAPPTTWPAAAARSGRRIRSSCSVLIGIAKKLVRKRGLEPPRDCSRQPLKPEKQTRPFPYETSDLPLKQALPNGCDAHHFFSMARKRDPARGGTVLLAGMRSEI